MAKANPKRQGHHPQNTNEEAGQTQKPVYAFGVYLDRTFLQVCRRKWKESTRMTIEPRTTFHLKSSLGPQVLRSVTRDQRQTFLDHKAEKLSATRIMLHLEHFAVLARPLLRRKNRLDIKEYGLPRKTAAEIVRYLTIGRISDQSHQSKRVNGA
jgi:hypothetical protein